MSKSAYDIPESAELLGLTPQYVRALIRDGTLTSVLKPIVPESLVNKHMITAAEIARYKALPATRTQRRDKRNKYVSYMTLDERVAVSAALLAAGLEAVDKLIRTANVLKPRKGTPTSTPKKQKGVVSDDE